MSAPTLLDHVVIAGPDLRALVAWFEGRTGVAAPAGGAHPTGTANHLVALTVAGRRGPHYIELIGPDPDAATAPTTFGIDRLTEPAVAGYAIHPGDIAAAADRARAAGVDPGPVEPLSRRAPDGTLLEWTLTRAQDSGGPVPFLIDWGRTPHPGLGHLPAVELAAFERVEPTDAAADGARAALAAFGLPAGATAPVVVGEGAGFRLVLRGADGAEVVLTEPS